jgi:hypothetical protein
MQHHQPKALLATTHHNHTTSTSSPFALLQPSITHANGPFAAYFLVIIASNVLPSPPQVISTVTLLHSLVKVRDKLPALDPCPDVAFSVHKPV